MEVNWWVIVSSVGSLCAAYVFFAVKSPERYLAISKLVYRWVMTLIAIAGGVAAGAQVASIVIFTALQPLSPIQEKAFSALPFGSLIGIVVIVTIGFATADLASYFLVSAIKDHERENPKSGE